MRLWPVAALAGVLAVAGVWLLTATPAPPPTPTVSSAAAAASPDTQPPTMVAGATPTPAAAEPSPTTPDAASSPAVGTRDEHEHDEVPAEAELWRPILDQFASAFTDSSGQPGQWQTRLARTVTPFLAEQLTYTDPTRIPTGTVTTIEILAAGAYEVRARVTYTRDLVLLVRLVDTATHQGWRVVDYSPANAEGGSGDVTGWKAAGG